MINQFYQELSKNENLSKFQIAATIDKRNVLFLEGEVDRWQQVVDIGHIAGKLHGVKGVVNKILSSDYIKPERNLVEEIDKSKEQGTLAEADIVIIGGGICGSGIARTLSKYDTKIIVIEKCSDISEGTSKANNGMIHPGHDPKFGTLKAKLNVKGNAIYTQWAEELNFHLIKPGALIIALCNEEDEKKLESLYENGLKIGVPGMKLVSKEEAKELEPNLDVEISRALWLPTAGFVEPYEVAEALMENAIDNGVKLLLDAEVLDIEIQNKTEKLIITSKGLVKTNCIINAAGLHADEVAEMVNDRFYTIHPRRGTLIIFDKKSGEKSISAAVLTLPGNYTKGGGNYKTPSGNPLWGPSAKEIPQRDDTAVEEEDFIEVMNKRLTKGITQKDVITYFSGIRASNYIEDFIVEASEIVDGFIHVAGIQSPGLASLPAISEMVEGIYLDLYPETRKKDDYNPIRKKPVVFRDLSREDQDLVIKENPKYGHIICRCETVSEGEIIDAIHGKVPATTIDAIKRRTRSGMGRCHGGFCGPKVIEILARELKIMPEQVTKRGKGTEILVSENR